MAQLAAGVGAAVAPLALVAAGTRDTRAAEALARGLVAPRVLRALEIAVALWAMERWRDIEMKPTEMAGGGCIFLYIQNQTLLMGCQHNLKSNPTHQPLQHLGRRWHRQKNTKSPQAWSLAEPLTLQGQTGMAKGLAHGYREGTGGYLEMEVNWEAVLERGFLLQNSEGKADVRTWARCSFPDNP